MDRCKCGATTIAKTEMCKVIGRQMHGLSLCFSASADEFPRPTSAEPAELSYEPLTPRQQAAITLRVPSSGTDWLDDMIRTARRDELAVQMMSFTVHGDTGGYLDYAAEAYEAADALIAAGQVK